jgi:CubicO group peptidase (beta-lactamase class C family)
MAHSDSYWSRPPTFPDASGRLLSTIHDFWAFAAMMTNNGVHEGERIISSHALDLMTTDHLAPRQREATGVFLGDSDGWGLGVSVPAGGIRAKGIPGGFGWDGGTGTTWRSDPDRDIAGILFTQLAMTSPEPPGIFTDFWDCAYGSIEG